MPQVDFLSASLSSVSPRSDGRSPYISSVSWAYSQSRHLDHVYSTGSVTEGNILNHTLFSTVISSGDILIYTHELTQAHVMKTSYKEVMNALKCLIFLYIIHSICYPVVQTSHSNQREPVNVLLQGSNKINNNHNNTIIRKVIRNCSCAINRSVLKCTGAMCSVLPINISDPYTKLRVTGTAINVLRKRELITHKLIVVLELERNKISDIERGAFEGMNNIAFLNLSFNKLEHLERDIFSGLTSLQVIDLSHNVLVSWEDKIFPLSYNLNYSLLGYNNISFFTGAMLDELSDFSLVDLSHNPFVCDCRMLQLYLWLKTQGNRTTVDGLYRNRYSCSFPVKWHGKNVMSYLEMLGKDGCISVAYGHLVLILIPVLMLLFVVMILFVLCCRFRHYLQYWRSLFKVKLKYGKHVVDIHRYYKYDAFVSYSNEDRELVEQIVTHLESLHPSYKLCVYERDFTVGDIICDCIIDNINLSRKTILVISRSFVTSQWCMWEMHIAQHKLFEESREGLILIKTGDIPLITSSPTLQYLMKTRIYLEWEENPAKESLFWTRLRNALA